MKDPAIVQWHLRERLNWLLLELALRAIWGGLGLMLAPVLDGAWAAAAWTAAIVGLGSAALTSRKIRRTWRALRDVEDLVP